MPQRTTFSAARTTAMAFGVLAGLGGLVHGVGEVLQGNVRPSGLIIDSWTQGPIAAHMGGEPGMTIVPNLRLTGILTIVVSLAVILRAASMRDRKGGRHLILLSVVMLLVGGGFGPPLLGILAGVAGTGIEKPSAWWQKRRSAPATRRLRPAWPWIFGLTLANGIFLVVGSVVLVNGSGVTNGDPFTNSFYASIVSVSLTILVGRLYDLDAGRPVATAGV